MSTYKALCASYIKFTNFAFLSLEYVVIKESVFHSFPSSLSFPSQSLLLLSQLSFQTISVTYLTLAANCHSQSQVIAASEYVPVESWWNLHRQTRFKARKAPWELGQSQTLQIHSIVFLDLTSSPLRSNPSRSLWILKTCLGQHLKHLMKKKQHLICPLFRFIPAQFHLFH